MNIQHFVQQCIKTESNIDCVKLNKHTLQSLLKIIISIGENVDMVKKNIYYNKPIDFDKWFNNIKICLNELNNSYKWAIPTYENKQEVQELNPRLFHAAIGIYTEAVEMFEALQKSIENKQLDTVNFMEEIGDVEWYQSIAYDETKTNPENVMNAIIEKLKKRYPNKFDSQHANQRNLDQERQTLEQFLNVEQN